MASGALAPAEPPHVPIIVAMDWIHGGDEGWERFWICAGRFGWQ